MLTFTTKLPSSTARILLGLPAGCIVNGVITESSCLKMKAIHKNDALAWAYT